MNASARRRTHPPARWAVTALVLLLNSSAIPRIANPAPQDPDKKGNRRLEQKATSKARPSEKTAAEPFSKVAQPFLKAYCYRCHGAKQQKGERRFDRLSGEISDSNQLVDYQDILDQLNLSEMPPKNARQPAAAGRKKVIEWLTGRVQRYALEHRGNRRQTVLRRLNAREYRNTIRDLLELDMTMFDPTSSFPKDRTTEHLDNVGGTLVTSGHLLARYLEAAEKAIGKALLSSAKPPVRSWKFRSGFRQQPEIDQVHRKTNRFQHMTLYDVVGADKHEGAYGPILAFRKGVPVDGYYTIRMKAEAVNRRHPYDPKFLGIDPGEPLRLGIVAGNDRVGQLHKPQPMEPLLAEVELADEARWYSVRVRLDKGYTPRFTFRNGLMDARTLWRRLLRKYPDQFPEPKRGGIVENRYNAIAYGKLPHIRIHEIEITGPLFDAWPTASQRALLGDDCRQILKRGTLTNEQMRRLIGRFLVRAYRRPARPDEVEHIMGVAIRRRKMGRSPLESYADALQAVLCSPNFLYLNEQPAKSEKGPGRNSFLSSYSLATRLSYFLWSSMPDATLLAKAADGSLQKPEVLRQQVERMLRDAKSDAFLDGFLDSWLNLRELGSTPPDRRQFRAYYHYDLGTAMRRETHLFTRHLIRNDLDIVHFLDADFTFANKRLADLYGAVRPTGKGFQKISLPDRRRGGLLGQASVLTVTANGIDTSPVVRGVWLLERILGTPPSAPPPDVEPLDPDIRGAKTIRDQLEKHRNVASCFECHKKIDPLGFALENFDAIGKWRVAYNRRSKVNAAGKLPGGASFKDVRGLKRILVRQKDQFARALSAKLVAYAIGRQLSPLDRPHLDAVTKQLASRGYGMRELIQLVVASELFRTK